MIFMTSYGIFFPALRPESTMEPWDTQTIQVRSRRKIDLVRLQRRHLPELTAPIFLGNTDYQWRAYCTPDQLAKAFARIALEIDYVKFKDTAEDNGLKSAFLDVWWALVQRFPTGSTYQGEVTRSRRRRR